MSCLETIIHILDTRPGRVSVRLSTLQERAADDLNALRPDLSLRKQIEHWAKAHGLLVCSGIGAPVIIFEQIHTHET